MLRPRAILYWAVASFLIIGEGFAQLSNHPKSENFKPRPKEVAPVTSEALDGDLSVEEYHRRRLIHEGLKDSEGRPTVKALDREINRAFEQLTNPASLFGGGAPEQKTELLDREAEILAEMDRQIERSKAEQERWNRPTAPEGSMVLAQEDSYQEERALLEQQKKMFESIQDKLKDPQNLSAEEMREMMRQIPGMNDGQMPEEFRDQMAENIYMALSPMRQMERSEVVEQVLSITKSKPVLDQFDQESAVIQKSVDMLRDPKAIPSMTMMVSDRQRLIQFLLANIAIFILGWAWKRAQKKDLTGMGDRFRKYFVRSSVLFVLRIGTLIFFFGHWFRPALDVLTR